MKPWAEKFYKSKAWRKCRDAYYESQHGLCEKCGGAGLIVHHKERLTPRNINEVAVTLNWDLLELLCQDCHNRVDAKASTAEGLKFDANGDLVEVHPPGQQNRGLS